MLDGNAKMCIKSLQNANEKCALCAQLRQNGKKTFTNYDGNAFTECEIV